MTKAELSSPPIPARSDRLQPRGQHPARQPPGMDRLQLGGGGYPGRDRLDAARVPPACGGWAWSERRDPTGKSGI